MASPTLLVLAAGMGSRYGGLKQLDPVGPGGETILDYAVFEAIRAVFDRVVFVIRDDFEEAFRRQVGAKYEGRLRVEYAFQSLDQLPEGVSVPEGREKPWGTGHAVWCARQVVGTVPFAVINADDFLGRDSMAQLANFAAEPDADHMMVGYTLANTLSEQGAVSRGVCQVDEEGLLTEVVEHTGIGRSDVGEGAAFTGQEIVSMNCWLFQPVFWEALERQWRAFVASRLEEPKAEFYLPAAVSGEIEAGRATVRVRRTEAAWFGVTYREDKPVVQATLAAMVARGEYPGQLF
ncbi:MAG: NTP transferase domain-containing protein [Candidatus Synoicihabitans palmerolidicus]|nr:NTP transferase domain-containing protein [Candidatus Synoicihabitans palmerolidicus]